MTRYTAADFVGVVGIVPTPALPGADRWSAVDTVALEETVRMTDQLVRDGVDILMTNGTFGEGASLTLDEVLTFNAAVVDTVAGRVPVFCGATTLNTRDTIDRGRRLSDLGADGLFLGRPMWVALDGPQIVEFHRSVAEALPHMSQVLYDNPSAFKGKIPSSAYSELASVDQVVAAKHMGPGLMGDRFAEDLEAAAGKIRLLVLADEWLEAAQRWPSDIRACWSGEVACGPAPLLALREAILTCDWDLAAKVHDDVASALRPLFPGGSFEEFSRYNMQIDRAEFEAAGWISPGPLRPPYTSAPEAYLEGGRETGRRWAELQRRYSNPSSVAEEGISR